MDSQNKSAKQTSCDTSLTPAKVPLTKISLKIQGIGHIPSKKNHHFPLKGGGLGIDKEVKERMKRLEKAIELALYSLCQTNENAMDLEFRRRLSMLLSTLPDDSLKEIPESYFKTRYVPKGEEGIIIEIEEITEHSEQSILQY